MSTKVRNMILNVIIALYLTSCGIEPESEVSSTKSSTLSSETQPNSAQSSSTDKVTYGPSNNQSSSATMNLNALDGEYLTDCLMTSDYTYSYLKYIEIANQQLNETVLLFYGIYCDNDPLMQVSRTYGLTSLIGNKIDLKMISTYAVIYDDTQRIIENYYGWYEKTNWALNTPVQVNGKKVYPTSSDRELSVAQTYYTTYEFSAGKLKIAQKEGVIDGSSESLRTTNFTYSHVYDKVSQ